MADKKKKTKKGLSKRKAVALGKQLEHKARFKEDAAQRALTPWWKRLFWSNETNPLNPPDERIRMMNLMSFILHAVLAFAIIFLIEWMSRRSFTGAVGFACNSTKVFLFNSLLVYVTLAFVYPFRHRTAMRVAISAVWLALGAVNGVILSSRVTPFNFTDLSLIGDLLLMKSSKYFTTAQEVLVIILVIVFVIALIWLLMRGPRYRGGMSRVLNIAIAIMLFCLTPVAMKAGINAGILAGYFGNLAQGYQEYGFAYSFACSVFDTGISEDDDYSQETIDAINNNIQVAETNTDEYGMPNIILIQLESFVDPYDLNFLSYSSDPTPNYHRLMEEYGSGLFTVPVVGAGTCNTEFECLTGMGIQFFGIGEYPYKTVMKDTSCESLATALGGIGYSTHVIHNNTAGFYSRDKVFAEMGFDSFTSKELMNATTYNEYETWLTDDVLVEETQKTLDASEDQSDFIYTITVQSHGSYPTEQVIENPAIEVYGAKDEASYWQWEYYINELYEVDQYIGNLIDMLEQRDEDTVVIMYGDHLPTMGLTDSDVASGNLFNTSYVSWNNFGLDMSDRDISSYQVGAYITNLLGIHEGTMFRWQQYAMDNNLVGTEGFNAAWRQLQYDLLYGKRYTYGGNKIDFTSNMTFGVVDTVIDNTDIDAEEGFFYIYGRNFTPWSKVYVNDIQVSTEYVSDTCLRVVLDRLDPEATITVNQVSGSKTVLRWSNSIIFHAPENFEELQANATLKEKERDAAEKAAQEEEERLAKEAEAKKETEAAATATTAQK